MDNHIEKMKGLLNVDSNGLRVIGIHGMGGLGKTTIAKAIYNQLGELFECHCFLEDVRENSNHNGIIHLQNQLLSKILKMKISKIDDPNEGINKIKDAVHGKKVFIVLDDVDDMSQIDKLAGSYKWFDARSRIIITTRNEDILHKLKHTYQIEGQSEVYRSYKPEFMDDDNSLLLFSKYAFIRDSPPEGYDILSKEVVYYAAGLPLVLVTIGASLFGEDTDLWEECLRKLEKIPNEDVLKKLRLSFDPLDNGQKQIFLDIACLFIGWDKGNPYYMWDDCEFYPKNGLNVLVRRSLITIGDDNILRMHDQLRDLGRQIASEGNSNELGRWSRLYNKDETLAMFKTLQGSENVKALDIEDQIARSRPLVLGGEDLRKLPNLRYLTLGYNTELDGDFEHCLPNLRWLQLSCYICLFNYSTPRNLHLKNLVILELKHSEIPEEWEGWRQFKRSTKLKVLHLDSCSAITRVPYLSTFSTLERLDVSVCRDLCSLDGIEELQSLRYLKAYACFSLERLSNLSKLSKLEELHVWTCMNLTEIQGLDKLESLKLLDMRCCLSLERLPHLSNLKKLKTLDASGCSKLIEIQGLDRLGGSLELLDISECVSLQRIPNLSNLKRLRELKTQGCLKLIEIHGLQGLESLENLDIKACGFIKRLLDLSNLKSLKTLNVSYCHELTEIQGLQRLESLEHLEIRRCISIERLPDLPNSGMLKHIDLSFCSMLSEVEGLRVVESMESLNLPFCKSLGQIPDLTNFKNLKELDIRCLPELNEIRGLEELKSLEQLLIGGCNSIQNLSDFSNLKKLQVIDATGCKKLTEIRGLEQLESLTNLYIRGCQSLENLPYLPNTTIHKDYDGYGFMGCKYWSVEAFMCYSGQSYDYHSSEESDNY